MRFSKLYAPTLKNAPADADIKSIELLIRGGFIRKIASGVFTYLPLGWKVIKKIENIVREEMDDIGIQEMLMPIIQPAEMWQQTGRWDDYGPEMMKVKDRHDRYFTLGPTHEEITTSIMKNELISYKQMPMAIYQITNKYRDEIRPRFGLLRSREFIMKDGYSFHTSDESLDEYYKLFYGAYEKILERMQLEFYAVQADSGAIGGNGSHEFQVLADSGESDIYYCEKCSYAATDEKAVSGKKFIYNSEDEKELKEIETPNVKTIDEVSEFLKLTKEKIIKSILLKGRNGWVLTLIRGDFELNLSKIRAIVKDQTLDLGDPGEIWNIFNVETGFVGPVGLKNVKVIADRSTENMKNFVTGANKQGTHFVNVNFKRDFKVDIFEDIRVIEEGEECPVCGNKMKMKKGIEVGQVFKLGTKYSEAMEAYYTDEKGISHPYIMGCYGWGISRTMAAIVEQLNDGNGILWPLSVAPFEITVINAATKDEEATEISENIYNYLREKNHEVIIDDRNVSPGFKFKDNDLIGIPLKVIVGKGIKEGIVELKLRTDKESEKVQFKDTDELYSKIKEKLNSYIPKKR